MPTSLYLHVPFCPVVCPYCDFHKMRRHEGLVARYIERLEHEAAELAARFPGPLDTVYFGGGTPSQLTDAELARITALLERCWGWPARLETTLEADPLTFDRERLRTFHALGFDRLSIGLQSTQDHVLRFLGRLHDGRQGLDAVASALEAGFAVSADLITAVPEQDPARDLHAVGATGVPHVSVYNLTVEANTPFGRRGVRVDPDREADDFELADEVLGGYGLERYEVSSHARPGAESQHNQVYWRGDYFLALGPSAASFLPTPAGFGERRRNPPIKAWLQGAAPEVEVLDAPTLLLELLMTGLRTRRGVSLRSLAERTGLEVRALLGRELTTFVAQGLLELADDPDDTLRATRSGMRRLDGMLRCFFAAVG